MSAYCESCKKVGDWLGQVVDLDEACKTIRLTLSTRSTLSSARRCHCCQDLLALLGAGRLQTDLGNETTLIMTAIGKTYWNERMFYIGTELNRFYTKLYPVRGKQSGLCFDREYINLEFARQWLRNCDDEHESSCRLSTQLSSSINLLFVDILDQCLVTRSSTNTKYVALSYVWGNTPATKTTSTNLEKMKEAHSLRTPDIVIPQTIRDAMYVTAELGLRYLWVDCLSIIQDDPGMHTYLRAMASIYANAYITLVIADGENAASGIQGLQHLGSPPRAEPAIILRFPEHLMKVSLKNSRSNHNNEKFLTPWATRGWTFQEGVFSNRILLFNGLMSWICPACYREEGGLNQFIDETPNQLRPHTISSLCQVSPKQESHQLLSLMEEFATREFTYDSDVMYAFTGVFQIISAPDLKLSGMMNFFGHPTTSFGVSLLWEPKIGKTLQEQGAQTLQHQPHRSVIIPSWSWFSWRGSIDLDIWRRYTNVAALRPIATFKLECSLCKRQRFLACPFCCDQRTLTASEKFGHAIFREGQTLSRPVLPRTILKDANPGPIFEGLSQTSMIGEVRLHSRHSPDLIMNESAKPYLWLSKSERHTFIGICIGEGSPKLSFKKNRKFPESGDHSKVEVRRSGQSIQWVYALCIGWKDTSTNLAERIGVASIAANEWHKLASKEMTTIRLA